MTTRISQSFLLPYVKTQYNCANPFIAESKMITNFPSLLQKNFGAPQDCTLVSITSIVDYFENLKLDPEDIYEYVEKVAKGFCYNGNSWGTIPIFICTIFNKVCKHFGLQKKCKHGYMKNVGFNISTIKQNIYNKNPLILNIHNDGRDYYKNHSVVVVGFVTYQIDGGKQIHMIAVYDNWTNSIGYVDYQKLSKISSVNYLI